MIIIIQMVHSFSVNIRVCQPENSDLQRGEIHFRGLTTPDINRKRMHQLFCYMTLHVSLVFLIYINSLLRSDVPSALKTRLLQQLLLGFLKLL